MSAVIAAITTAAAIGIIWFLFAPQSAKGAAHVASAGVAGPVAVGKADGTGDDGGGGGKVE